ncbi:MAG TPA: YraN family protein [Fimbriimonadales bacterium]|nr:YraN family protein [Fimbriimonadales bacterium]
MSEVRKLGREAESIAADYLVRHGYTIVTRNYHARSAEIDLVCMDGDTLVFVEVRSLSKVTIVSPEETVNPNKQRKLTEAASHYLSEVVGKEIPVRFDVVTIVGRSVRHYKDAFRP